MVIEYRGEKFEGYNKPKRTPNHPTKKGVVLAKEGDKVKMIRFGDQSMTTAGKVSASDSKSDKARRGIVQCKTCQKHCEGQDVRGVLGPKGPLVKA